MYALLEPGANLSFVTPLVLKSLFFTRYFDWPFVVSTAVGESIVDKRADKNCPISLPNRVFMLIS